MRGQQKELGMWRSTVGGELHFQANREDAKAKAPPSCFSRRGKHEGEGFIWQAYELSSQFHEVVSVVLRDHP